ncbi:PREDICTED: MATH domain and coiled-coil domain-containing protein At2g42480-like [Brassica oleracea var. oleracea]|uniref:MATH domain-containing protein n=1 Tax=Brassica oleracea var. oleracea TaxID=109376 RepID=A0A0D3BPC0_BRAOL|nr:PREDICTED: MATH domain and coiled-coil domain-containing protein At2g42480-like [Brassica oleracea var. oleracea]
MSNQKPSLRFEIENFSEQDNIIASDTFVSGGCEWYIFVGPNGDCAADSHLSLSLQLEDSTPLRGGVKRSFNFYFVLLNQSNKELYRSTTGHLQARNMACGWNSEGWIYEKTLPLSKFQEKGFLEKDKLIIEFYIQVVSNKKNKNKTVDINGFQVLASQVTKVRKIFTAHPDIALDFKPTIQEVKTAYMNVLLRVIKTLHKPPKSLSETRLSKASSELSELMKVGFKLDWLRLKLDGVSLERKKTDVDASQVQQVEERVKKFERKKADDTNVSRAKKVEERVKNPELMELSLKLDSLNTKLNEVSLERKKAYDTNESRATQVEERVKNLELMELSLKYDSLNTKLDEVSLERKKKDDTNDSRAKQVEERVKNLELMELSLKFDSLERKKASDANESRARQVEKRVKNLELMDVELNKCCKSNLDDLSWKKSYDVIFFKEIEDRVMGIEFKLESLNTKLEEISKENKKADDADGSLVQQLEESVKNIELMVSHLKVELEKKKNISSADGFLLVD